MDPNEIQESLRMTANGNPKCEGYGAAAKLYR